MHEANSREPTLEFPPRAMRVAAWIALPGSLALGLDFFCAYTIRTWQTGPYHGPYFFGSVHSGSPAGLLMLLFVALAHAVLLIVLALAIVGVIRRAKFGEIRWIACGALLLTTAVIYVPQSVWHLALVELAGPGPHGTSLLVAAAGDNEKLVVDALLANGVPVDGTEERGNTALNWACTAKRIPMANYLITRGADVKHAPACDWIEEILPHPDRVRGSDQRIEVH